VEIGRAKDRKKAIGDMAELRMGKREALNALLRKDMRRRHRRLRIG
jgi:hypothetical protein